MILAVDGPQHFFPTMKMSNVERAHRYFPFSVGIKTASLTQHQATSSDGLDARFTFFCEAL